MLKSGYTVDFMLCMLYYNVKEKEKKKEEHW